MVKVAGACKEINRLLKNELFLAFGVPRLRGPEGETPNVFGELQTKCHRFFNTLLRAWCSSSKAATKKGQSCGNPARVAKRQYRKYSRHRREETHRVGDHIWWISDVRKFQSHYPNWKSQR